MTSQKRRGLGQQEILIPWINSTFNRFSRIKISFSNWMKFHLELSRTSWIKKDPEKGLTLIKNIFRLLSSFYSISSIKFKSFQKSEKTKSHMDHEHICHNHDGFRIWIKTLFYFLFLCINVVMSIFLSRKNKRRNLNIQNHMFHHDIRFNTHLCTHSTAWHHLEDF